MEEELNLDNILVEEEVEDLFGSNDEETQDPSPEEEEIKDTEKTETTEVNADTLFDEKPESVGSEEHKEEKEDTESNLDGTSPKNFYSSIAKAFAEEDIFPNLTDEAISKIQSPEDFKELIENLISAGLEERLKRVYDALNSGIEPNVVKQYEAAINYLDSINEEQISDESEKGETLRKQLIFRDFINRGYSEERANREVKKSIDAGTDIDDAKEALKSNSEYFQDQYKELLDNAEKEKQEEIKNRRELAEQLKKTILEEKNVFGDLDITKSIRQKAYENISKPVYKDPDTGEYLTAIQKYEMENKTEFLKNVSLIYTLTDGFKNLDGLVKNKVRREVKKGFKELEHTLNNTARTSGGSINFASGVGESESYIGKGITLDI